jgi:3-dehydroquinate synthase
MSNCITVSLGARSYDIHVGRGLLSRAGELLKTHARGPVPVVTDEIVAKLHLGPLLESLAATGIAAYPVAIPPGEGTKGFRGLQDLLSALLKIGVERGGLVIALGGGVVGDLTGFAAGILKRGIDVAQIPTSLLAQVDSAVGGKTAINVQEGKNLVGLFHQPKCVIADTKLLMSLPRRELLAGYAEVVKYGALGDKTFFGWLEQHGEAALQNVGGEFMERAVAHSCRMKAAIVTRDEQETDERALLNLGHTFGHALEAATGYSDRLLHGEGVAIGMILAFQLSVNLGFCPAEDLTRLRSHLSAVGLPVSIAEIAGKRPLPDELLAHMAHDKKARGGAIMLVLAREIGNAFTTREVSPDDVRALLAA